jgi:hypothetical protein
MAELCVGVGREPFCIIYQIFNRFVWPVGCSVVYIHAFELDIKGTDVLSVEADNILSDLIDFVLSFGYVLPLVSPLFYAHVHVFDALGFRFRIFLFYFGGERSLHFSLKEVQFINQVLRVIQCALRMVEGHVVFVVHKRHV